VGFWTFLVRHSSVQSRLSIRRYTEMYVGHTQSGLLEGGEEQIVAAGKVAREAPMPRKKSARILRTVRGIVAF
jgi:hypothetical protein